MFLFQCSSASRKFLNLYYGHEELGTEAVSVLFSEPKIPQFETGEFRLSSPSVSVLFSEPKIPQSHRTSTCTCLKALFQCSSASRKFLNRKPNHLLLQRVFGFSALQRAENSSITSDTNHVQLPAWFQCSSASRKFLNSAPQPGVFPVVDVSVLFSEPKIPQSVALPVLPRFRAVSVLFSEPKIPQFRNPA
mgnify:CR=1 FL=1